MNILRIFITSITLVLLAIPTNAAEGRRDPNVPASNSVAESAKAETLVKRLEEIKALDKSTLSRSSRQQLNKEVRAIKKELKSTSGGVYLSVGAIIVIVLLLILLV
jgi:hypothetical protein